MHELKGAQKTFFAFVTEQSQFCNKWKMFVLFQQNTNVIYVYFQDVLFELKSLV